MKSDCECQGAKLIVGKADCRHPSPLRLLLVILALAFGSAPCLAQFTDFSRDLIGTWRDLQTHLTIVITSDGDVFAQGDEGLQGRVGTTISGGANFEFENETTHCAYNVAFLKIGNTDWKLEAPVSSSNCPPSGIFAPQREKSHNDSATISDCDRLAASRFDNNRPVGIAGVDLKEIDTSKAVPACQLALQNNPDDPRTIFQLGRAFDSDVKTSAEAVRLYKLAAEKGYAPAQVALGFSYDRGLGGLPKDAAKAAELYRASADQGYSGGQYDLGVDYEHGIGGLSVDLARAAELYREAADQGFPSSQYSLGLFYLKGRGVARDVVEATRLFQLAEAQGNADAAAELRSLDTFDLTICNQSSEGTIDIAVATPPQGKTLSGRDIPADVRGASDMMKGWWFVGAGSCQNVGTYLKPHVEIYMQYANYWYLPGSSSFHCILPYMSTDPISPRIKFYLTGSQFHSSDSNCDSSRLPFNQFNIDNSGDKIYTSLTITYTNTPTGPKSQSITKR